MTHTYTGVTEIVQINENNFLICYCFVIVVGYVITYLNIIIKNKVIKIKLTNNNFKKLYVEIIMKLNNFIQHP